MDSNGIERNRTETNGNERKPTETNGNEQKRTFWGEIWFLRGGDRGGPVTVFRSHSL